MFPNGFASPSGDRGQQPLANDLGARDGDGGNSRNANPSSQDLCSTAPSYDSSPQHPPAYTLAIVGQLISRDGAPSNESSPKLAYGSESTMASTGVNVSQTLGAETECMLASYSSNICQLGYIWLIYSSQILRWSSLGAGVLYGVYHQASLSTAAKLAAIDRQYEHKQKLIDQAKAEYTKSKLPESAKTSEGKSMLYPVNQWLNGST